jgi:hypothetical protein
MISPRTLVLPILLALSACTTRGTFKVPPGTELEVYRRPVKVESDGSVTTQPFFWTAAGIPPGGGIEYKLLKKGEVVKSGRLRAKFRPVSIFWPPFALIYWPMGFNPEITYDLVNDTQK